VDVNLDGNRDLLVFFDIRVAGVPCGATAAILSGKTFDGLSLSARIRSGRSVVDAETGRMPAPFFAPVPERRKLTTTACAAADASFGGRRRALDAPSSQGSKF